MVEEHGSVLVVLPALEALTLPWMYPERIPIRYLEQRPVPMIRPC